METDEDWLKFFQAALVCIRERDDHVQALAFCRQLYNSGQEFYAGLENEDTAMEIYSNCLYLLNEMIQHPDPVLVTKCFYRVKLLSSRNDDPTNVWLPVLNTPSLSLAEKLTLLRNIQEIIDEYSEEEHPIVWHCMMEIKISYGYLLDLQTSQEAGTEIILREFLKFFVHVGWKLFDKNLAELVCRMCIELNRKFSEYPEFPKLLILWAHALEKVGKLDVAIKKAREANDEELISRLQENQCFESESVPDEEWIRDTGAYVFFKSQEQRKWVDQPSKKKKSRSRPKRRIDDDQSTKGTFDPWREKQNVEDIRDVVANLNNQIKSWKDVTEFDLPITKSRNKRYRRQKSHVEQKSQKHQQQEKKQSGSHSSKSIKRKTGSETQSQDEFHPLPPELQDEYEWEFESSDEEYSSEDEIEKTEQGELVNNFYEESCKVYNNKHQHDIVDEASLVPGLDLSDEYIENCFKFKEKKMYDELFSAEKSLKLCKESPQKYKHCKIKIITPHKAICYSLDDDMEIEISGRSKCGKVFNRDHVVVEILKPHQDKSNISIQSTNDEDKTYGRVIGITKTKENLPRNPIFICTLDHTVMHHMKPVCKTVPKIYVLNKNRKTEYQVEIYKYNARTKDLEFHQLKKIDPSKRNGYTFLVCYITWKDLYPLGAVIRVHDTKCDLKSSLRLQCLRSNVSVLYKENTVHKVEEIMELHKVEEIVERKSNKKVDEQRKDLSDSLRAFTIDEKESKDLDDALSVTTISEDKFEIGVHIADVGSVIHKNDPIDIEAQERATTFYPGENLPPYHMLPEPLATSICSLLPCVKRKAISVFFIVDKYGNILRHRIESTYIQSKQRFTYHEVQQKISEAAIEEDFKQELCALRDITKCIRARRLGNRVLSFPFELSNNDCSKSYFQSHDAHVIVEECMILANHTIGQTLIEKFPNCIPLRVQSEPSSSKVKEWMENFPVIANFVLSLQHQSLATKSTLSFDKVSEDQLSQPLPIQKHIWNEIVSDYGKGNFKSIQKLVGTDEFHPQQAMAYEAWISFQETSSYQCSGSPHEKMHFSLRMYPYVHFTSPIRRYADLIVNRLVHALLENKESPYSQREVEMLCKNINERRPREFERQCRLLHLGRHLEKQPRVSHSLVVSASEKSLFVCFPGRRELTRTCGEIQYNSLKVKSKPILGGNEENESLSVLSWQQRLYSSHGFSSHASKSKRDPVNIDPHQKVTFISLRKWKRIIDSLTRDDMNSLEDADLFEHEVLPLARECQNTQCDVSSETIDGVIGKQYTEFRLTFNKAQILPLQIGAEQLEGMLMPVIHLLEITNNVKCCIQHIADPVRCFAAYATRHAGNRRMALDEYVQRWLNIFRMESVTNATKSIPIVINDLHVCFRGQEIFDGFFVLSKTFCLQRDIDFNWQKENEEEYVSYQADLICIRCELVNGVPSQPNKACSPDERWIWVGHGETKLCQKGKVNGDVKVHFKLHRNSTRPISSMKASCSSTCTVEILQLSDSDRHIENAFKELETATQLAKSIALREKLPDLDETHLRLAVQSKYDITDSEFQPNNEKQLDAIKKALSSRFTLIQGPPGTGKTLTGIKLILLFMKINLKFRQDGGDHKQVVYCGPSNKSVDLVARWIRSRIPKLCPNMARMYGSSIESTVYTIPGRDYLNQSSCKDNRPDPDLADISLHNLIRKKGKPHAEKLSEYDKKFRDNVDGISNDPEKILEYKRLLKLATQEELKQYDVIFCTTAVATNPKFLKGTEGKIFQIIIDEAGMCTEPETMAPIIASKAEQVVLIGDHKQLQPIIICQEAAKLGLSKSLFERYADNAVFLEIQYRMNPKICDFPSNQFYTGKLKTGPIGKWKGQENLKIWPTSNTPLLFCHVEGKEEYLSVSTEEGNQQSRSNMAEVNHAVKVYEYLMSHEGMDTHQVKVMSQYNAQCFLIRDALKKKGFINSKVHTVVSSQGGEWDYVIFSTVISLPWYRIEPNSTLGWRKRNMGFITDQHQINVALTRARKGIIIIGNKNLLQCDLVWRALLDHYSELGCVADAVAQNLTPLKRQRRR